MAQPATVIDFDQYRSKEGVETESADLVEELKRRIEAIEELLLHQPTENEQSIIASLDNGDRVSPEKLYEDYSTGKPVSQIVQAREILRECTLLLDQALESYDSEIERENHIEVFLATSSSLDYFPNFGNYFSDAVTLLQMATANHHTTPYQRNEIVALKSFVRTLRENVNLDAQMFDECLHLLQSAGVSISGPLGDIELNELT